MKIARSGRQCLATRAASSQAVGAAVAVLLLALLAGCRSDDVPIATALDIATSAPAPTAPEQPTPRVDEPNPAAPAGPTATRLTTPPPTTATTPEETPAPTPTTTVAPTADLTPIDDDFPGWLRVNGFGPVDFGSGLASAQSAIAPRFGDPSDVTSGGDCFLTVANWNDFSLAFESDRLVGWFYSSSTPPLESPSGVAPGISQSELRRVYSGVDISETTLGIEFFFEVPAGFIGGFFTAEDQTVTSMYAGQNCFFR